MKQQIVIVGATSAIAVSCARLWAEAGEKAFVLIGRDSERLGRVADDLKVRSPGSEVCLLVADFCNPEEIAAVVKQASLVPPDIVLIAHGMLPDQAACEQDLRACQQALEINAVSPVLFAEGFVQILLKNSRGVLAIIGSVAGDRGRKSNYVYGAAKGLVSRYAEGLQHRLAGSPCKVVLIKPGPTDTPMTAHLKATGVALADVQLVAAKILKAIAVGKPEVYVPGKWLIIMRIIRHLPRFVFNKLNI